MEFGRRHLLRRMAVLSTVGTGGVVGGSTAAPDEFDPGVHGFGFRNWATDGVRFPEHEHESVEESEVRRVVGDRWAGPFEQYASVGFGRVPRAVVDAIAKQVYVSVNQQSASSGHCYGMVFAAQGYYERPNTLPAYETASEIPHPESPLDGAGSTVATDIDVYQITQALNLHAWIGRRAMFFPEWIDYGLQLDRLTDAVDEYGTAGITVFSGDHHRSHQVLVYDYHRKGSRTHLAVYDPNYGADRYAHAAGTTTVTVNPSRDRPVDRYGKDYHEFVFNGRDRLLARQSAREEPPLAAVTGDLADTLLCPIVFLIDTVDVDLAVVGPDGRRLHRDRSRYVDREKSDYGDLRYRYGADPGRYHVRLVGRSATDYELRGLAGHHEGARLDTSVTGSIDAGEVHRYVARVPESDPGTIDRASDRNWPAVAAGALAGAAGIGSVALWRRRRGSGAEDGDGSA